MGLFDMFKKKGTVLGAYMNGKCVSIKEVPDPTFGAEILGKGVAIIPEDGNLYAPADGEVMMVFPTGHAIAINTPDGAEILLHIGLETVGLNGEPFTIKVEAGQKVKKGDLLIVADLEAIKAAGLNTITPMVITNSDSFTKIESMIDKTVKVGDDVVELFK